MNYEEFIERKRIVTEPAGFEISIDAINPMLFDWQKKIVQWSVARGRAALFEDCGLGKGFQQIEFARIVSDQTGKPVIIFAPLAVAQQTVREGAKLGVPVRLVRDQSEVQAGINVTNYDRLHLFTDPTLYSGIVLDESSSLKGFDSAHRKQLTDFAKSITYRLCCTATPAPNDLFEIINHAEFLDVMSGKEVIALFFTQDGNTTHSFRLKGHAREAFWKWMASWSVAMRRPSDIGHSDDGFILPPLAIHQHVVDGQNYQSHTLFAVEALTLEDRRKARQASIGERVAKTVSIVQDEDLTSPGERWIIWCNLNAEQDALFDAFKAAGYPTVSVDGRSDRDGRVVELDRWLSGDARILISKPAVFGFGLNLQVCARMAFVGLSDSWEQLYQATRRCWRFGQTRPVQSHIVTAAAEGAVVKNIERKERQASEMMEQIVVHMRGLQLAQSSRDELDYRPSQAIHIPNWLKDVAA